MNCLWPKEVFKLGRLSRYVFAKNKYDKTILVTGAALIGRFLPPVVFVRVVPALPRAKVSVI